jgi:transcription elongation factor GreA
MLEISRSAFNALTEELEQVEESLIRANEELETARAHGDLSENAEFEQSKMEVDRLQKRKRELFNVLQTSKVINTVSSTRIMPGTLITVLVEGVDEPDYSRDLGLLMFDSVGNTVLNGKITPEATLGKEIKDGGSGVYPIIGYDSKRYNYYVEIVSQERLGEFLEKYPTDTSSSLKEQFRNPGVVK